MPQNFTSVMTQATKDFPVVFSYFLFAVLNLAALLPIFLTISPTPITPERKSDDLAGPEKPLIAAVTNQTKNSTKLVDVAAWLAGVGNEHPEANVHSGFRHTRDKRRAARDAPAMRFRQRSQHQAPLTIQTRPLRAALAPSGANIDNIGKFETVAARTSAAFSLQSSLSRPLPPIKSILKKPSNKKKEGLCSHRRTITFGANETRTYETFPKVCAEWEYDWLPYLPFLDAEQEGIQARIAESWRAARQMNRDAGVYDDLPKLMPIPVIEELGDFWWKNGPK